MSKFRMKIVLSAIILTVAGLPANARSFFFEKAVFNLQQQEDDKDEQRRIWDAGLINKRASGATNKAGRKAHYIRRTPIRHIASPPQSVSERNRRKPVNPNANAPADPNPDERVVGVTIWRLRPARNGNEVRVIEQDAKDNSVNGGATEWTQERTAYNTRFNPGDRVRVTIEVPFDGYLYVFDREQYKNNKFSEPYLIFPTLASRRGKNLIQQGDLIDIPGQDDSPFKLSPSRPDQTAETLTFIISPKKLEDVPVKEKIWQFPAAHFAQLEKQWNDGSPEILELEGGAGQTWSESEKQAGSESRKITQDDPAPQTVYKLAAKQNGTILFSLPLYLNQKP